MIRKILNAGLTLALLAAFALLLLFEVAWAQIRRLLGFKPPPRGDNPFVPGAFFYDWRRRP